MNKPMRQAATDGMRRIPGGTFLMGSDRHYPEEAPAHRVRVAPFEIDETCVTNRQFAAFVAATGYVTVAERPPDPTVYPGRRADELLPGSRRLPHDAGPGRPRDFRNWWGWVSGRLLAPPRGAGQHGQGPQGPPRRPRRLRGRRGLRDLGGQGAADRGRMGVRRPRRPRRQGVRLGRRVHAGRRHSPTPGRAPSPGRTSPRTARRHLPGRSLPAERLRPLRGLRQRLGMDDRLVRREARRRGTRQARLLRRRQPARPGKEGSHDPAQPAITHPAPGGEGRLLPLRALLLPPLPARGAPAQMVDTGTSHIGFRCIRR